MARIVLSKPQRGTDVNCPSDEEPGDDAPRPQQPSQPRGQQPSLQPPQPTWQQPSQPFAALSAQLSFRSVNGLGTAVSILICVIVLARAVLAASEWYTYKVVKDYVEGRVKDPDRLDRADFVWSLAGSGLMLAVLAAGVVFIVWLWRARGNAELFCYGRHRRGRGWVIGGWFCPVVNFWFPKQNVDDVIAASDPRTAPLFPDLRRIPRQGLVLAWWLTWIATEVTSNVANPNLASDVQDVSGRAVGASVLTLLAVLTAVCAVLAIRVVPLVNRLQISRPWTPWWATDPSTAAQLWPAQYLPPIHGASVAASYGQGPQQPYSHQPYGAPQMGTRAGMETDRTGQPEASGWRFRTPPGWPEQPVGWQPPAGWAPDPQWPPAPSGWLFWEPDTEHPGSYAATPQAEPSVQPSAAYDAAQVQPIANWAARPRPNQGLGIALLVLGALLLLGDILMAVAAPAAVRAYEAAAAEGRDPAQVITAYGAAALLYFLVLLPLWIVGSLWLFRARENAVLIAPDRVHRSAVWAWLGWVVPIVFLWVPKQIIDDCWRITSSSAAVGQRGRYRDTRLWWGLWIAYTLLGNVAGNLVFQEGIMGNDVRQGVVPALEIAVAVLGILAFAAWVPVVRGLPRPKPTSPTWTTRTFDGPSAASDGSQPL
jgi:hypothetical protein